MQNADRDLKNAETFSMTTMCNEFGVTPRALRFYEQRGLLAPQRCGEARAFTYRDRARLQLILRGKQFGFTLSEIKTFLDLYQPGGDDTQQMKAVLPKMQSQLKRLQRERFDLDEAIASLETSCRQISERLGH